MTAIQDRVRVCPRCGSPAGQADYCAGCGEHLAALPELPTRAEWQTRAGASGTPRGRAPSLRPLLHPTETSRLVLASVVALGTLAFILAVVVASGGAPVLLGIGGFVLFLGGSIWAIQQVRRALLLGVSVKVGYDTLPELQELIDEVRETLHYHRRVDVYVTGKGSEPITTTSYLGTRIIVIEGGLVAELLEPDKRPQLTFLIGRSIGALRAKHARLDIVVVLLQAIDALKFVSLFIAPWYRATTYSGDQIGMMCCADLDAALEATRRLLVGKELAADMGPGDVLPQVQLVQHRFLPRVAELFLAEPHTTNRYANLLCFGRYHDPELWERLRAAMGDDAARILDELWRWSPYRRRTARLAG